jgi:hypothetical protein
LPVGGRAEFAGEGLEGFEGRGEGEAFAFGAEEVEAGGIGVHGRNIRYLIGRVK